MSEMHQWGEFLLAGQEQGLPVMRGRLFCAPKPGTFPQPRYHSPMDRVIDSQRFLARICVRAHSGRTKLPNRALESVEYSTSNPGPEPVALLGLCCLRRPMDTIAVRYSLRVRYNRYRRASGTVDPLASTPFTPLLCASEIEVAASAAQAAESG